MTRRSVHALAAALGLVAVWLINTVAPPAFADGCQGGTLVEYTDSKGQIVQTIRCPAQPPGPSGKGSETRTCNAPSGAAIPCRTEDGVWNAARSCYVEQDSSGVTVAEAPDGDKSGIVMACTHLSGARDYYMVDPAEPAPPDPRQLAQTAISRMELQAIRIGSFPQTLERAAMSLGVVGRNVWMWVDRPSASTFGPVTKSVSAGGYTVTATARVVEVVWDMGNGDKVTCGRGTAYVTTLDRDPASPDCGYRYLKDGHYRISATSRWEIAWSGIGQSGVIPMQLTRTERLDIAEIQVVNVPVGRP